MSDPPNSWYQKWMACGLTKQTSSPHTEPAKGENLQHKKYCAFECCAINCSLLIYGTDLLAGLFSGPCAHGNY